MHDLYNLKKTLIAELEAFGKKGEITKVTLDTIDKLAHATKNVVKVIDSCEQEEYSNSSNNSYRMDRSYRNSYDSYSRDGNVKEQLHRLMGSVSDERTRDEIRRMIDTL